MGDGIVKRGFLLKLATALAPTGLALFVFASLLGHPESFSLSLCEGETVNTAPFIIRLEHSAEVRNEQNAVTDWYSRLWIHTSDGVTVGTARVGRPFVLGGWRFYQSGWENVADKGVVSTLQCKYDPLVPVKAIGLWTLLSAGLIIMAGAVMTGKSGRRIWLIVILFILAFTWIVLDSVGVGQRSLPPVLRSAWFPPHLTAYMSGYAVMATLSIIVYVGITREHLDGLVKNLLRIGWGLLTCGIVLGALWAEQAWGTFWSWDPKESWALATWLSYLLCLHLPTTSSRSSRVLRAVLVTVSFLLLQMCWWGVKLLPSSAGSLHLYGA